MSDKCAQREVVVKDCWDVLKDTSDALGNMEDRLSMINQILDRDFMIDDERIREAPKDPQPNLRFGLVGLSKLVKSQV